MRRIRFTWHRRPDNKLSIVYVSVFNSNGFHSFKSHAHPFQWLWQVNGEFVSSIAALLNQLATRWRNQRPRTKSNIKSFYKCKTYNLHPGELKPQREKKNTHRWIESKAKHCSSRWKTKCRTWVSLATCQCVHNHIRPHYDDGVFIAILMCIYVNNKYLLVASKSIAWPVMSYISKES